MHAMQADKELGPAWGINLCLSNPDKHSLTYQGGRMDGSGDPLNTWMLVVLFA
jgi:hypothetical protein